MLVTSWWRHRDIRVTSRKLNSSLNRVKTLINKANRVLVQHSDDAEFCPGFQSCEYNIKFQQSHSDVSVWTKKHEGILANAQNMLTGRPSPVIPSLSNFDSQTCHFQCFSKNCFVWNFASKILHSRWLMTFKEYFDLS